MTYTLIDSEVLASSASSVTFTSIPADYRDLILVVNPVMTSGAGVSAVTFNSDTGSNYSYVTMSGDGSSPSSSSGTTTYLFGTGSSDTEPRLYSFQIMDYSATDKHKTVLQRRQDAEVYAYASRWASTSAIASIQIGFNTTNSYAAGSTFYLYGIEA